MASRKKQPRKPEKPAAGIPATDDLRLKKTKIKVVGCGDGGGAIVAELAQKLSGVEFVAANTDWQKAQRFPPAVRVWRFGEKYTRGLGAGGDIDLARHAALAEKEKIAQILRGTDLCFFVSCLGGGTGSGATPVLAKVCRQEGILSCGIFTLPFKFEGDKKMAQARQALEKMKPYFNAVILLPNEKIFQALPPDLSFKESLSKVNQVLAKGLEGLIGLIFRPGLINIDFADLKTVLSGHGKTAYLTSVEFERGLKIEEIKKKIFQSAFLNYNFCQSRQVLFNIVAQNNLSLAEMAQISELIFSQAHPAARLILGISFDASLSGLIRVVLLALAGQGEKPVARKKGLPKSRRQKESRSLPGPKKEASDKEGTLVRRTALQVQEETRQEEEMLARQEQIWERPAILRKNLTI